MATLPDEEFGAFNTNPPTLEFPHGSYKNESVPNVSQDGTPVTAKILNDMLGADEALYAEVGMTPTNVTDTALSSQKLDALRLLAGKTALRPVLIAQGLSGDYGYFSKGFTVSDPDDVGVTATGEIWKYVGAETLPYVVPQGTDPSAGDWEQIFLNDHSRDINRNAVGAHDDIYTRDTKSFDSLLTLGEFSENRKYKSGFTLWLCSTSGRVDVGDGLFLEPVGDIYVDDFGVIAGVDTTTEFNTMEGYLLDGDTIVFSKGVYKGVYRTKKAVSVKCNKGAKLSNATDLDGILQIGPDSSDFDTYNVTETELKYLDTTFTIPLTNSVNVGDIGYLWDSSVRPADSQPVNYQCVKVKSIASGVITIEDKIETTLKTGQLVFYHSTIQPKNITITNFKCEPDNTHLEFGVRLVGAEKVRFLGAETTNTVGNSVSARYCYDVHAEDLTFKKPRLTGSGQGYGLAYLGCYLASWKKLRGEGMRHIFNGDSIYNFTYEDSYDSEDKISSVSFAHNGFAGNGTIINVRSKSQQHTVISSSQGFGAGAANAKKSDHPLRNVTIEKVKCTYNNTVSPDDGVSAVYLQHNVDNVHVNTVNVEFENDSDLTIASQSNVVRVNGVAVGDYSARNLTANKIGRFHFSNGDRDGALTGDYVSTIKGMSAGSVNEPILHFGEWALSIDELSALSILNDTIVQLNEIGGDVPFGLSIGNDINYPNSIGEKQIYSTTNALNGEVIQLGRLVNSSIAVTGGETITASQVQNRGNYLRFVPPVGTGSPVNLAGFPAPYVNGQVIKVSGTLTGRQDLIIPAGTNVLAEITFDQNKKTKDLVAVSGKWREV